MPERTVVVGASLGGLRAAEGLRAGGYDGHLVLVGAETHPPYDRPPLSKQVLLGKVTPDATALPVADSLEVEWVLGSPAAGLSLADGRLLLEDGRSMGFDRLVIATGASPRLLPAVPAGPGVHYLRTLDDAAALRADLESSAGLVVIGAGFIGLEVGCSAQQLGVPVVVVEALPVPLERALGPEMGALILDWHRSKGLDVRTGAAVRGLRLSHGRPEAVLLADGSELPADTVVVGVGVAPATGWLAGSGVDVADGVLADPHLRVLSAGTPLSNVVAVGDVVRWHHRSYGETVRVEHWTHAAESGEAAARALLHGTAAPAYDPVPYFWSDQHGVKIQVVGRISAGDEVVLLEGSLDDDRVVYAFGRDGRLTAALGVRRPARVMALQRAIAEGAPFPPAEG
ncbi:MAG TPA: FAD-dependent oxidoreductase [Acidimicrobiales bacterium]|nr:FAD-dependent oxidoreductase [Acidimicrobiales bacterium]